MLTASTLSKNNDTLGASDVRTDGKVQPDSQPFQSLLLDKQKGPSVKYINTVNTSGAATENVRHWGSIH